MAAVPLPPQPQTLRADLTEQDCGPFENFPVSLRAVQPSSALTVTDA